MNFSKVEICSELTELYGNSISLYRNNDSWSINVIFFHSNLDDLNEKWEKVSSAVSMCYQADIVNENEFEKWNLYIIYSCTDKVDKELKALIENNKFSSRKIVEDNQTEELTNERANNLIVKHITNTDLIALVNSTQEITERTYTPKNEKIWELINRSTILGNKEIQYNIIEKLKNLNHED